MGSYQAAKGLVIVMVASLMMISQARTINVGGSENWHFGFNYTDWAIQNSPFFTDDTLVFKYDPPSDNNPGYSVYLLPNLWSYLTCDFRRAKLLADANQGGGDGFKVVLNKWRPLYFASAGTNADHCKNGHMKFFVLPWPRWDIWTMPAETRP